MESRASYKASRSPGKSPGSSPGRIKLREDKDKTSESRLKKLKRRLSASFGRLAVSKDHSGSGVLASSCSPPDSKYHNGYRTENGRADMSLMTYSTRDHSPADYPRSLDATPERHRHRLLPHYPSSGTPEASQPHRLSHSQSRHGLSDLVRSLGHSLDDPSPPSGSHRSKCSAGVRPSVSSYYHDSGGQYRVEGYEEGRDRVTNGGGYQSSYHHNAEVYANGHTNSSVYLEGNDSLYKRHHSTGNMLLDAGGTPTGSTSCTPSSRVGVVDRRGAASQGTTPLRARPSRPKSEGNLSAEAMRSRRASSFGLHSPFGKANIYEKKEQLGEGSYATVYKGLSLLANKVVALKEIRLQPEEGTPFTAIREASLLKGLKHANIVTLHDIIHTKDALTFVFEFVHTDLGQYLEKHQGGLNPRNVKLFLFQLLRGLAYCHHRQILHRDLKPQNLLITEIGELKLADFGLARAKSIPSHTYSFEVVTLWYRPPDVLLGSTDYSTSLDIWGVGCIFTEMISGSATFAGVKDTWDQLDKIWQILGTPTEETWKDVTNLPNYQLDKFGRYPAQRLTHAIPKLAHIPYADLLAFRLLQSIFAFNQQLQPKKRITAVEALRHRYFADLPSRIYDLSDDESIFNIPGVRLAPEMDELLKSHVRMGSGHMYLHNHTVNARTSVYQYNGPSAV